MAISNCFQKHYPHFRDIHVGSCLSQQVISHVIAGLRKTAVVHHTHKILFFNSASEDVLFGIIKPYLRPWSHYSHNQIWNQKDYFYNRTTHCEL